MRQYRLSLPPKYLCLLALLELFCEAITMSFTGFHGTFDLRVNLVKSLLTSLPKQWNQHPIPRSLKRIPSKLLRSFKRKIYAREVIVPVDDSAWDIRISVNNFHQCRLPRNSVPFRPLRHYEPRQRSSYALQVLDIIKP